MGKTEEERKVEEQKKAEEKEEEEERRRAAKEEEEKKKREEKEERQSRRKGQGKFPGLSVSRLCRFVKKKVEKVENINFSDLARSQILRRHTTYDKGKSVHIHSWHRNQVLCYLCSLSSVSPSSPSS